MGCSGWQYRDWRGVVYPVGVPQRSWLPYYAKLFDTVEVNNSFYRLPSESAVSGWAASVPPGFVFALKLGAFGSHRMKLRDAASWLPNHMVRVKLLGDAAGPTLVQLPPRWRRNAERLDEFLTVAPPSTRWAVEVRERSWLHDEVYDVLARHDAALCVHDLLEDHPFLMTTDWTYVRFHGPDALVRKYYGAYGYRRLRRWATRLNEVLESGRDVYCYFNNDWEGHAVADASWLRRALEPRDSP